MEVIAIVLPLALLMAGGALWMFVRAVRAGQYDDLDTPPLRVLTDDMPVKQAKPPCACKSCGCKK